MSLRPRQRVSRTLIAWVLAASLAILGEAAGEGAKGLGFSIVSGGEIVARVRVDRVYADRQTRGFFKIGVLPKWVAEGVEIHCGEARHLAGVLGNVRGLVRSGSAQAALEFQRMSISMPADAAPRMWAGRVRFKGTDSWELKDGVRWVSPGGVVQESAEALLIVRGAEAGLLNARIGTNQVRVDLFGESRTGAEPPGPISP